MSTLLSAFYDIDFLCKTEKSFNTLNLNSMLDKKAVGSPLSPGGSSGLVPAFLRRHSTSNLQALHNQHNSAKLLMPPAGGPGSSAFGSLKEGPASPPPGVPSNALMNRENRFRDRSFSENGDRSAQLMAQLQQQLKAAAAAGAGGGGTQGAQVNSTRYKTELCRPYEESGTCKYGDKCQFAHGYHELRSLTRHPKYKTELCRTFHTVGFCPYGPRCHFIHNAEERRQAAPASPSRGTGSGGGGDYNFNSQRGGQGGERPRLQHSLSFSGFPSAAQAGPEAAEPRTPPPLLSALYAEELQLLSANNAFNFSAGPGGLGSLLTPLAIQTQNLHNQQLQQYCQLQQRGGGSPPPREAPAATASFFQPLLRRLSESPVFDAPPSPPDSLSDRDSYLSGSLSSSGSLSGSESPGLDSGRRLPIFSRISVSDD
ncbi:mRNA decay activator protein ZFP36L2 isoform X2 [Ambystoma mexicanum]|uniref:mRNA decay activator protein ZFP36L2 isoform X2 n=1 Tax=Ambystoma mexicanum TaxID=8296 RepID=UPI0037E9C976